MQPRFPGVVEVAGGYRRWKETSCGFGDVPPRHAVVVDLRRLLGQAALVRCVRGCVRIEEWMFVLPVRLVAGRPMRKWKAFFACVEVPLCRPWK